MNIKQIFKNATADAVRYILTKTGKYRYALYFGIFAGMIYTACNSEGSEIGNPVSPGDTTLTPEVQKFISAEEFEFLEQINDSLTVDKLHALQNAQMDSMIVKSFNRYYFK